MAIAIGLAVWRGASGGLRWLAPLPALGTFVLSLADHAAFNAVAAGGWPDKPAPGFPLPLELLWTLGIHGRFAIALNVALLLACLGLDAARRRAAGPAGRLVPDEVAPGRPALLAGLRGPLGAAGGALWDAAAWTVRDALTVAAGYAHRANASRADDLLRGALARRAVLATRADAMAATVGGAEPRGRRRFRLAAVVVGVAALAATLASGVWIARAIGRNLLVSDDGPRFFAGLLDSLARWWSSLGFGGQLLLTALAVAAIMAFGGSFLLALGVTGIATWVLGHGHGLADLIRNPSQAIRDYLATSTPGSIAWDAVEFALTFIPGTVLGKLLSGPLAWLLREAPASVVERLLKRAGAADSAASGATNPLADALGDLVQVSKPDPAADLLAQRIGGESRVKFADGPPNEFDVVSDRYVAQTKPAGFTLNKTFRDQAKTTFDVALATGRTPYFHFEGPPGPGVLEALARYAQRYGIEPVIDVVPLGGTP